MTNLEKAESLLNMLDPDQAARLLESMLAKIELRKRLATKRAQAEPVQRKPLTEDEIWGLAANCLNSVAGQLQFARAIERAHGIKEAK